VTVLLAAAVASGGCGASPVYSALNPEALAGAVSSPSSWRVYGNLENLPNAIDGNVQTAATSRGVGMDVLTVDLGKVCLFNLVIIDHGSHEDAYARRVAVLTSVDGHNFDYHLSGPGNRRITSLLLERPVLARYVRLQAVLPGPQPWAVAEVYLQ
jgi:hypothetical protein